MSKPPNVHARKVYLRTLELGAGPREAAALAGHPMAAFAALAKSDAAFRAKRQKALAATGRTTTLGSQEVALSQDQVSAFCALIERNFSEDEAAKIVGVAPTTMRKAIKRNKSWGDMRARARARGNGLGLRAMLINWAYEAIKGDSKNAVFAFRMLVANNPDCGLIDPERVDEMRDQGEARFVDAIVLRRAVDEARERMLTLQTVEPLNPQSANEIIDQVLHNTPSSGDNGRHAQGTTTE